MDVNASAFGGRLPRHWVVVLALVARGDMIRSIAATSICKPFEVALADLRNTAIWCVLRKHGLQKAT